ncbi:MAG: ABC transporter ATP-binding protein [Acidimicrobiales bacterium]|nr:ABC transporter ATP-binding protein [Acidimicrobiales bacterium]
MLRVDALTIRFGDVVAVDGVSLTLAAGERLAVLGPSGCGKSMLLRAIAGLEAGDGTVSLDGVNLTDKAPDQRPIGLMFQDHALFPHRTVEQNVAFGLRMAGNAPGERDQRVHELLALVGMEGFGDRATATLSGGEAQRAALARALAPGPNVLLLDEPLGSLDRHRRERLIEELPDVLRATGTAAIHVTHDHDEAFAIGDRLAVMHAGKVLQVGPPGEVWAAPASITVARVLGHTNEVTEGAATVVWRSDALRLDPAGPHEAMVERVHFRGVEHDVRLRTPAGQPLRFVLADPPAVGDNVRFSIEPERVIRFG